MSIRRPPRFFRAYPPEYDAEILGSNCITGEAHPQFRGLAAHWHVVRWDATGSKIDFTTLPIRLSTEDAKAAAIEWATNAPYAS